MPASTDTSVTDAELASVVSYVHDLLRLYERAAQEGVGEGERLVDLTHPDPPARPRTTFETKLDAIGFAVTCVGEVLVRRDGPAVIARIQSQIEAHYGWTSAALLRQLWGGVGA